MTSTTLICGILLLLLLHNSPAFAASYKDDIGHTALIAELGANAPDGSTVHVTQAEAQGTDGSWMPDIAHSQFTGKSLEDKSGIASGISGHATSVGTLFYGSTSSIAPQIQNIDLYLVDHEFWYEPGYYYVWLRRGFLGVGWLYGGKLFQPVYDMTQSPWILSSPSRVANHSWVGDSPNASEYLRRLDFVIAADEYIQVVGLHNIDAVSDLLQNAFNAIAVGRTDGVHSDGTLDIDETYVSGRTKPDVVAPRTKTSYAAPIVAAAAALLVEAGHRDRQLSTDPAQWAAYNRSGAEIYNAERAETVKAAILAGADRVTHNTATTAQIVDYRSDPANRSGNGLDSRFGAGQVNIYHSYFIIAGGEQNSQEDAPASAGVIGSNGFDVDPLFGGLSGSNKTASYFYDAAAEDRRICISLVWHLDVDGGTWDDFDGSAVLHNLDLALYDVTVEGYAREIARSAGMIENTENIWAPLTPGRKYLIEVTAAGPADFLIDYAIAWRTSTPPDTDGDGIPDDDEVQFGLDYMDPSDATDDADGDGLSNLAEIQAGSCITEPDTDGDGYPDGDEVNGRADPLDPFSVPEAFAVPALNSAGMVLAFLALAGFGAHCLRKLAAGCPVC